MGALSMKFLFKFQKPDTVYILGEDFGVELGVTSV